jgi:F-type H+-transporting ATPase subunit epsilon
MPKQFTLEIITLEGLKLEQVVYQVVIPTTNGVIGVLAEHMPLLTVLKTGIMSLYPHASLDDDTAEHIAVMGGFADISGKHVRIMTDNVEYSEEIDEAKAKLALENAKKMQMNAQDQVAMSDAMSIIERESTRLKLASLRRRK